MRDISFILLLLLLGTRLAAQEANPLSLRPGDRIRVDAPAPGDEPKLARVVIFDPYSFAFYLDGRPNLIYTRNYIDVDTIEVRRRLRYESAREWAVWGGYLGTAAGLIGGPFIAAKTGMHTGTAIATFGSLGGILGGLSGGASGWFFAPSRWYRHVFPRGTLVAEAPNP